jgi:hypothetical protein
MSWLLATAVPRKTFWQNRMRLKGLWRRPLRKCNMRHAKFQLGLANCAARGVAPASKSLKLLAWGPPQRRAKSTPELIAWNPV